MTKQIHKTSAKGKQKQASGSTKPSVGEEKKTGIQKYTPVFLISGIIAFTIITYSSVTKDNFLNWDDNLYVTENQHIQNLNAENIKAFFTQNYVSNYLPITMLSYALDFKIDKLNPRVFVLTNLIIHIFNTLLVYWLVLLLAKSLSDPAGDSGTDLRRPYVLASITSVLFAVHPMNVESVAWISERKNLLFVFFFLLSLINYVKYAKTVNRINYLLSILFFIFSLLSKGVAVSLTLCVVSVDFIYQRKLMSSKVILEKIPFFLLSILFGIITILAQKTENTLVGAVNFPFYEQFSFASYGFVNYLSKLIVPVKLSAYYSYPMGATVIHWLCLVITISILVLLILFRKRFSRLAVLGILFYLSNIVFLIQIVPVGNALMADRYIYLSSIGYFLLLAVLVSKIAKRYSGLYLILALVVLCYGYSSHNRLKVWNNSLSFWNDVIVKDKHIPRAWNNRGIVRNEKGDYSGAMDDFNEAIKLMPEYHEAYNNRGIVYFNLKMDDEAIHDFTKAIKLDSVYVDAYYNRGTVRNNRDDLQGALQDLDNAIRLNPDRIDAYLNRANVRLKLQDNEGAIKDCRIVLKHNKNMANAYGIMASAFYNSGKLAESIEIYSQAILFDPGNINYYHNRGAAYFYSGKFKEAIGDMSTVLQNSPLGISYYIRGMAYIKLGNTTDGCTDLHKASRAGLTGAENEISTYCRAEFDK
jgi:protein O-mannosyl-transferase